MKPSPKNRCPVSSQKYLQQMIRRKRGAVPYSTPRDGRKSTRAEVKYKNEEATRQLGSLFFKGE
jgi:hypothetical protein